ncbi:MAG: DUF7689 domain-containing protein [Candidatus Brocadiales bacterium]
MSEQYIEKCFPYLMNSGYSVESPATKEYNCIAWAAGDNKTWWWPDPRNEHYWPPGIPRTETKEAFITAYEMLGYTLCKDAAHESGFEKIAIYVGSNGKPTHAARQLNSGYWTSKLGQLEDIEHTTVDGLVGYEYGSVAVILKRPI